MGQVRTGVSSDRVATAHRVPSSRASSGITTARAAIPALDGVRAVACLLVVGYHNNLLTRDGQAWKPGRFPLLDALFLSGSTGVTLFFVLSGFLLFLPYARALLALGPWPDARVFYWRRAWRILPGYYASLLLLVMLQQPQYLAPSHWRDLALFLTMFMDSTHTTFQHLNGPYWTLAIEWQFYLLLPLIAWTIRAVIRHLPRLSRTSAIVLCLAALMAWGVLSRVGGAWLVAHPTATWLVPRPLLNVLLVVAYGQRGKFLEDFACGMLAGLCFVMSKESAPAGVVRRLARLTPWMGVGALLTYLLLATRVVVWAIPASATLFTTGSELACSFCFAGGIVALLLSTRGLRRLLSWPPLGWIGRISYSLYIWHLPLLVVFMHEIGPVLVGVPNAATYGLYWMWAALVVMPFATGVYWLVEQPGIRTGERARHALTVICHPFHSQGERETALGGS
jgi:peptidoglycan/LPS O-acetylase OafA/YrhL